MLRVEIEIKGIFNEIELTHSVDVIRKSFATVAHEFNLTRENAPTNAAFIEFEDLLKMKANDIEMYGLFKNNQQIGFFTIEKNSNEVYYLNKLAILPEHRHNSYGGKLLDFAFECVQRAGGGTISIGIINENIILKNWYKQYGFTETAIKHYPHLSFAVCLLAKHIY